MRPVPTLLLAAALSLGATASLADDQAYRFYNSDGTYSTLMVPSTRQDVIRVYNADGSYTLYVPSAQPEPYRAPPLAVHTPTAQQLYAPPAHSYTNTPEPYASGSYIAPAPYVTYPQAAYSDYRVYGVTRQDGSDVFMVRYDTDGDGELGDEQGVMRTRAEIEAEGNITLMESHSVEPVDSNGDGFVSIDEWRAEHPAYLGSLDLNNNGMPDNME